MEYQIVSAGVNVAPGLKPLTWAEKDATDVASFMASAQGPLHGQSITPLRGGAATRGAILRAIREAGLLGDYVFVYFSGHGTEQGIATADGILDYEKARPRA
ncbi:MAG: caspase family protein [Sandaracinaceae bacterium]|nr:caspase family protein [Sandaracinaceae bacterium]